jgi:BirA family biotin operon repressor/biotin-[acetyl-CoA-carboxylase] ligase
MMVSLAAREAISWVLHGIWGATINGGIAMQRDTRWTSEKCNISNIEVTIKWPNDIYCGDKKLAGILIENMLLGRYISNSIVGIGINVNQTNWRSDAPNPISLSQILGHEVEREALLEAIACHFMELYTQYTSPTPTLSRATLHDCYTRLIYRRGIPAPYTDAQGPFTATLCTVEPDGRLILKDQQGRLRSYLFKEVSYII